MTKTKIGVTKGKRSTHNLSCQSITTSDLFKTQPIFSREVFKGDSFNIKMYNINRVDALPVSSFVNINNKFHWFYVKYNQIWKPFDSFMTKAPYAFNYLNQIPLSTPWLSIENLLDFFIHFNTSASPMTNQLYDGIYTSSVTSASYDDSVMTSIIQKFESNTPLFDFVIAEGSTISRYVLSAAGRKLWSILYSLGYRIPKVIINLTNQSSLYPNNIDSLRTQQSALPLMAYLSVLTNYYVPTKFRDYLFVNSMSYIVNPIPTPGTSDSYAFVERVYRLVLNTFYGSDYFTDSLVQPYNMAAGAGQLDESPTGPNTVLEVRPGDATHLTPVVENAVGTNDGYIDEYILAALKAVSSKAQINALTRNNMLASALQQFGYKPESSDMIPYLLKQINSEIVVEPEVSQAATELAPLGYKAGCGVGKCKDKANFNFDDYGILICVNSISPDYFYSDGVHKEMLHTIPEDFFDPAFVNLGFQPIANAELRFLPSHLGFSDPSKYAADGVFGFQNKYAEYGYKRDFLGGDFCIPTVGMGLETFHFNRRTDFQPLVQGQNTEQFAVASWGTAQGDLKNQYDRIFGYTDAGFDHIQQWTYFQILAHRSIPQNGEWTVGTDDDNSVDGVGVTDNINN